LYYLIIDGAMQISCNYICHKAEVTAIMPSNTNMTILAGDFLSANDHNEL